MNECEITAEENEEELIEKRIDIHQFILSRILTRSMNKMSTRPLNYVTKLRKSWGFIFVMVKIQLKR
jgi:hypothetical protein